MKGQDKPRTPCHSGRETAATKLGKVFFPPFFSFSFPLSFSFFFFSVFLFYFLFLSFFFFSPLFFKVEKETNRRQEADLQGFGVVLKGL